MTIPDQEEEHLNCALCGERVVVWWRLNPHRLQPVCRDCAIHRGEQRKATDAQTEPPTTA